MKKNELKAEALNLSNQGMSYGKIAEQLGVGKTTVYSWIVNSDIPIQNIQKTKKVVPNEILNEQNELEDLKKELQYDFGTDKDISALVELRKAEETGKRVNNKSNEIYPDFKDFNEFLVNIVSQSCKHTVNKYINKQ